jgi:alpha-beta hydrolase superfamily lysophospholipase
MRKTALGILCALAACGGTQNGGGGDDDGGGDAGTDPPMEIAGCDGATLLSSPADPAAPGPWPVGARTVTIGRLTVEIWYPAMPGSDAGGTPIRYDIRQALNPSQRTLIPDADNPWQTCDCVRDLPLDAAHGPYPVVVFVHGTAAFRHQSVSQTQHWASRGFIVVAADHPGLMLGDFLAMACPDDPSGAQDLSGDIDAMLTALAAPAGELAFLAGKVATDRVAVVGHSAGGSAAAGATGKPGVRVIASLAGGAMAADAAALETVLFMGGTNDNVVQMSRVTSAWNGSATPRHLVGIGGAGHLVFSDLCETKNAAGKDLLQIASDYQLCGASFAGLLFDCNPEYVGGQVGWDITNHATTAAFERALQCSTTAPDISTVEDAYPEVDIYMEAL